MFKKYKHFQSIILSIAMIVACTVQPAAQIVPKPAEIDEDNYIEIQLTSPRASSPIQKSMGTVKARRLTKDLNKVCTTTPATASITGAPNGATAKKVQLMYSNATGQFAPNGSTEFMLVKAADQSEYAQIKRGMMGSWYDVPDCVGQPVNQTWSVSYKAQRAYTLYDVEYYNFNATLRIYF